MRLFNPQHFTCVFLILAAFVSSLQAAPRVVPSAPKLSAASYALMDYHSGHLIVAHEANQHVAPASLTKMMTGYVLYKELEKGNITLDDEVIISKKAWRTGGSRTFLEVGKKVSLSILVKGIVIQSGNDACVAVAEHVAGSEETFVDLMNQYAAQLGMNDTHFANSTGLPNDSQYTTARDMAILAQALIRDFPQHYKTHSEKFFLYNDIKQYNRNKLLWRDNTVDGVKTGYTQAAGYCLVASAKRNDMRLISVVMGAPTEGVRAKESQSLINYGFRFFRTHKLYESNQALKEERLWMGTGKTLQLGLSEPLFVTVPRGQYDLLEATLETETYYEAPIAKGSPYGELKVTLDEQPYLTRPLIALEEVSKGSWWQRLMDRVVLFVYDLLGLV